MLPLLAALALVEWVTRFTLSRLVWREVARFFILLELLALAIVRRFVKPRFEIRGSCHKGGACCRQIVGDPPAFIRDGFLLNIFTSYHRIAHRFSVVGRGPSGEVIFSCGHLQGDGRCGIYNYRPFICRNYPERPLFARPTVLPGCGYTVAPHSVARMRERPSLRIVNPGPSVHHPTRATRGAADREADFEWVDDAPA